VGAYSAPPDPLAVFKGPTSKGVEGRGRGGVGIGDGKGKGKRRGSEGRKREGREEVRPPDILAYNRPCPNVCMQIEVAH